MESGTGHGTRPSEFLARDSPQLLRVIHSRVLVPIFRQRVLLLLQLFDLRLEPLSDSHPSRDVMYEILHEYTTGTGGHLDTALTVCNEPVCYDPFFFLACVHRLVNAFRELHVCHSARNAW